MELTAQPRTKFGRATTALRKEGLLPAELYGHGVENVHLSVSAKDFRRVFKAAGESTLIELVVEGKKRPVMIHEVITHPVSDVITGVDFYQVRLDEKLQIKVPLSYVGEAPAVKEKQGVLIKAVSEIKIEALPADIPHVIEVNLATMTDIGQSISINDIQIPKGVKVLDDMKTVVVTVTAKMTEEEEAKLAAAADVTTIKSETEEKKAERDAVKAEGAPAEGAAAAPATANAKAPAKADAKASAKPAAKPAK